MLERSVSASERASPGRREQRERLEPERPRLRDVGVAVEDDLRELRERRALDRPLAGAPARASRTSSISSAAAGSSQSRQAARAA
jgi:hypothetical protein